MSKEYTLIITTQLSQEVDGVIDLLRTQGHEILRWNLCQYPENEGVTFSANGTITFNDKVVKLNSIKKAWLHHFGKFTVEKSLKGFEREVALKEATSFYMGILQSIKCKWINEPIFVFQVSNKLFQLSEIEKLKITCPPYIITNRKEDFIKFQNQHEFCIIKSLQSSFIQYGKKQFKFYTTDITEIDDSFIEGLTFSPIIIQKKVSKQKEYRSTVVGNKCLTTSISYDDINEVTDVRNIIAAGNERFFKVDNNAVINKASLKIASHFNLKYCGIDWIESKDGEIYFLEINPLASFKWYELSSNQDITRHIAKLLNGL